MANQPFRQAHILVVEDDSSTAFTIFYSLQNGLPSASTIRLAYNLEDAREWIEREKFNGIVVDFSLPDGNGMELIESILESPGDDHPFIFLTSGLDPDRFEVANILFRHPEITFIEKPFRFEALADLIMDRLLPETLAEQNYYGLLLFDLIQAYSIARRSATVRILTADGKMGVIALDQGEMIHAFMEGAEGIDALKKMARNKQGRIRLDRGCPTAKRTIHDSTQHVLIETYRQLDEEQSPDGPNGGIGVKSGAQALEEDLDALFNDAFFPAE